MTEKINKILRDHELWLKTEGREGKRARLENISFFNFDKFDGVNLHGAIISNCTFTLTSMIGVNLSKAYINHCSFIGARIKESTLFGAFINDTVFTDSKLQHANFQSCDICADFTDTSLDHTDFSNAKIHGSCFNKARINNTIFSYANLVNCLFEEATIKKPVFFETLLYYTNKKTGGKSVSSLLEMLDAENEKAFGTCSAIINSKE